MALPVAAIAGIHGATIPLPADQVGAMQVEVRAAKRDGTAIASDWDQYRLARLAPPTGATCRYD
ncbi:MAG: hypothetical protein ACHQ16_06855, partial [Candidatus Lutacidiplasmatales archaeon]